MSLINFLNTRTSIAKSFTKKYFIDEVKKCLEDYRCEKESSSSRPHDRHLKSEGRYDLSIPYIFSTHESMLSSIFERGVELVITDRGASDEQKALMIKLVYKYLRDKLDLETFYWESAWWMILVGFVSSHQYFDIKINGQNPVFDMNGQPMIDENGQTMTTPIYEWNDPKTELDNPNKTYFGAGSEFKIDGSKMTYVIREILMDPEEIESKYGLKEGEIEATEALDAGEFKDSKNVDDLKKTPIFFYSGKIPDEAFEGGKQEIKDYDENTIYNIIYTSNKVLHISDITKKTSLIKWFGSPIDFFGFGIGKTLRSAQKEMSIRRQQQIKYADEFSYPWLTIDARTKVDQRSLNDVKRRQPLVYTEKPPQFLVPPQTPQNLIDMDAMARSDAQFISGTLDLSKGAQDSNTVKTATGQQLFAQSQDKRINKIRIELGKYYKQIVINLCKLAQENWEEDKILEVAGDNEEFENVSSVKDIFDQINFDTDIDIQLDTISVNKDTIAERAIALYDKVKDDPLIDRKKVFMDMLKDGYQKKNPENYLLPEKETGSQPTQETQNNPQDFSSDNRETLGEQLAPNQNGQI